MIENHKTVQLKPGREGSLRRRHPWVFSGALQPLSAELQEGDVVGVKAFGGEVVGYGHYCGGSIAVKMLSFEKSFDADAYLDKKLSRAIELRRKLGLLGSSETTGFRLVHAEGDDLPGLIVDLYEATAVLQFHSVGMARWRDRLIPLLQRKLPGRLKAIYDKSKDLGTAEGPSNAYVWGEPQSGEFKENGLCFFADWEHGQKTGFFLDQRDNRKLVGSLASGKRVLNCFSYTGGFSVYALSGGALSVTSVDASAAALAILERNLERNFSNPAHRTLEADCMKFLEKLDAPYDLVILDPPAFVKHRSALRSGIKGYEFINLAALSQIEPGGILCTFSCSQLLPRADFYDVVERAAKKAGREITVISELHQAACHPVHPNHPEGDYLKGLALEVK
ncbi:MAG: class I SAM-dependent rRNA methyltransferase [Deltaproteobacteria bacterium]|nr:class I SAM-dependent rRNA methyltransferase [Deltaproteobacteria bacterium]